MARIRSLKPDAFESESLAKVSVSAERTFFGLSTIVDDRGRITDKPAAINGNLWAMRGGHTTEELDDELCQLVKADELVCRYTGCDGRRYLHLVTWDLHQKIDRPSKSRLPRCPEHTVSVGGLVEICGLHDGDCQAPDIQGDLFALGEVSDPPREHSMQSREHSPDSREDSMLDLGPRTVDLGPRTVAPSADAKPRAPRKPTNNAADVIAAYVEGASAADLPRPAESLRNRIGRQANKLLTEGYPLEALVLAARHVGAGGWNDLALQLQRDGVTANGRASPRGSPHQPYRNPDDQAVYDKPMYPKEALR